MGEDECEDWGWGTFDGNKLVCVLNIIQDFKEMDKVRVVCEYFLYSNRTFDSDLGLSNLLNRCPCVFDSPSLCPEFRSQRVR